MTKNDIFISFFKNLKNFDEKQGIIYISDVISYKFTYLMEDVMKILVLGNGFDLDHGLPTSYYDFMNFCNKLLSKYDSPTYIELKGLKLEQLAYMEELKSNEVLRNKMISLLKDNCLFRYFNRHIERYGKNWVDLETIIKSIVNEFKSVEDEFYRSNQSKYSADTEHRVHQLIQDLQLKNIDGAKLSELALSRIQETLSKNLSDFSLALELYIYHFINNTPIDGISPDIVNFDANRVIIFNYSNTYERIYGGVHWNESIDYVHGKATQDSPTSASIILGITSPNSNISNHNNYVEFEKYFQRITKKTGSNYRKWLQEKLQDKEKIEVAFFGHSLDSSDIDIIKDLIYSEKSAITIYYYDDISYKQIVSNLIDILGKEQLIEQVSGTNPKISFVPQAKHRSNSSGGVEITRDIQAIYKLHELSKTEVDTLFNKIKLKYITRDLSYFYSQRKAISLFDALGEYQLDEFDTKEYLSICKQLYCEEIFGNPKRHDYNDWRKYSDIFGLEECPPNTKDLIDKINRHNKRRYKKKQQKQNPYLILLEKTTIEEMNECLIEILSEENPTDTYWKNVNDVIESSEHNKILEQVIQIVHLNDLPTHIRPRYKHFLDLYTEYNYGLWQYEQYLEDKKMSASTV